MPSIWSAWKSTFKSCRTSPPKPTSTASESPSGPAFSRIKVSSQGLPERLWNQAYDELKAKEPDIVEAYEKILTNELRRSHSTTTNASPQKNEIEQTREGRWSQMERLVRAGLERTEKEATVKQGIEQGMQAVNSVKGIVDKAVQASPEAALAWVGICFALEMLSNPITEAGINRQGIAYVVSRMNWYWDLAGLLLDENRAETSTIRLRDQLEEHVAQLYQKLLLYQMNSVCLYYRNRGAVFLRDMLKLDNWDGKLDEIRKAEEAIRRDSEQYNTEQIRSHLQVLVIAAGSQQIKLQDIYLAIQDEPKRQCLKDLRVTDPRDDKGRIESTKGGLLEDSYRWILPDLIRWRDGPQNRLLWIEGDPGKGKTMLLCGIIDQLSSIATEPGEPAYFFCQSTDARLNTAAAVLRGLIYFLIIQNPPLISYVQDQYDQAGKLLFEDANAWVALSRILTNMLDNPILKDKILIVDALDECVTDLQRLLDIIYKLSSSSRARWIVSSRNWPPAIEETLGHAMGRVKLCLELKADSISAAVETFIQYKVDQLTQLKRYDEETKNEVRSHLRTNANDTFLWVALVCQELEKVDAWYVSDILKELPGGLENLYDRMMRNIEGLQRQDPEFCRSILSTVSMAYRPLHLEELGALSGLPSNITKTKGSTAKMARMCGSFLTIRDSIVYFVHQSAKEFLLNNASDKFLQSGVAHEHHAIFLRSIDILKKTLRRDVYGLRIPGFPIERVSPPDPDPLAASRYSCIYWADHLCDSNPTDRNSRQDEELRDGGTLHAFFKDKYLYWLEALSLLRGMSEGVIATQKLKTLLGESTQLADLLGDAHRFVLSHKSVIEIAPLQVYASALLFSPTGSAIRRLFGKEEPNWISLKPIMGTHWSACLATLEGHGGLINSVAFTADGQRLASASRDGTVRIWIPATGVCLQTLRGHGDSVKSVAFTADGQQLASTSLDSTVKIWDPATGKCLQTLEGRGGSISSVAFTADSQRLASAWGDCTKIWDLATGACLQTLRGHDTAVHSVAFRADGQRLASASRDGIIKVWNPVTGACLKTVEGQPLGPFRAGSVAFTADGQRLASVSSFGMIKIWHPVTGICLQTLVGHKDDVSSVAFRADGQRLASGSVDGTIKVWNPVTGACLRTFKDNTGGTDSVTFRADGQMLASGSLDGTVKIWDPAIGDACLETPEAHSSAVHTIAFAVDSQRLASGSDDGTVKVWDSVTGACLHTLRGDGDYRDWIEIVAFTADSQRLVSAWRFGTVKVWDPVTGECLQTWKNRGVDDVHKLRYEPAKYSHLFANVPSTNIQPSQAPFPRPKYDGYSFHSNKSWIMKETDPVLWLPPEYRPETGAAAVSGKTIGIGCPSGRVLIMSFSTKGAGYEEPSKAYGTVGEEIMNSSR